MYIIDLEDMCPAGVLVQAYKQETSDRYTLSVSEGEVRPERACLVSSQEAEPCRTATTAIHSTSMPLPEEQYSCALRQFWIALLPMSK